MYSTIFAIASGAALGALLRWKLGEVLNAAFPAIAPGTLAANWIGGYLAGLALAYFAHQPGIPAHWRLFVVTGFLGGLTTFSTFSTEIVGLLHHGRLGMAAVAVGAHVLGTLGMTLLGVGTVALLHR